MISLSLRALAWQSSVDNEMYPVDKMLITDPFLWINFVKNDKGGEFLAPYYYYYFWYFIFPYLINNNSIKGVKN